MATKLTDKEMAEVEAALRDGTDLPRDILVDFSWNPPYRKIDGKAKADLDRVYAEERQAGALADTAGIGVLQNRKRRLIIPELCDQICCCR